MVDKGDKTKNPVKEQGWESLEDIPTSQLMPQLAAKRR